MVSVSRKEQLGKLDHFQNQGKSLLPAIHAIADKRFRQAIAQLKAGAASKRRVTAQIQEFFGEP
jgi:hypothetical protein